VLALAAVLVGVLVGVFAGAVTPWLAAHWGIHCGLVWWIVIGFVCGGLIGWCLTGAGPFVVAAWLVVVAVGVPLAAIDLACLRLPDALVLPAALVVGGLAAAGGAHRALASGALTFAAFAVLAVLPRSALGFGDVKLAAVLGTALGWFGWQAAVWGPVLAFVLGGFVALGLLISGRARVDSALPFGPYLLAGALLAMVL
jgi:leader peptidase (prepilin peptidase)/N-methyltransferase